jgi:hypothetical protein
MSLESAQQCPAGTPAPQPTVNKFEKKGKKKMEKGNCCGATKDKPENPEYEIAEIEKTGSICVMCETYAKDQAEKRIAIICCEGSCLRGEIARQASNLIRHKMIPDRTVRICLRGAFTKNTGQRVSSEMQRN